VSRSLRPCALPFLLLLAACAGPSEPWSLQGPAAEPGPYEALDPVAGEELREVVVAFEGGRLEGAWDRIRVLAQQNGGDIRIAIWHQEIELAWMERMNARTPSSEAAATPRQILRDRFRTAAEENPSPLAWILAARLEDDDHAARLLLRWALELDPEFAWAHYALAHVAAREGAISEALDELLITFELEPDHLPALRLFGWCAAQAGNPDGAVAAFETWLEFSGRDLLATANTRTTVILDLALIHLTAGRPERAEDLIVTLPEGSVDEIRRLAALTAARLDQGDSDAALEIAEMALAKDRTALLPSVQKALLLELWSGDEEAARRAWRRVLEVSAGESDLAAVLQRFRAQLHLARLSRENGEEER
jgi:tetratricopeptide (TPR) repeat protein